MRCKDLLFDMEDHREAKHYSNIIYLCFLADEVFLQICYSFNSHNIYLGHFVDRE